MSEGDFDVESVIGSLQKEYPSHAGVEPEDRIEKDIRTNLAKVMSTSWKQRGASQEKLDDLYRKGFTKIKELYEGEAERQRLQEVINGDIEYEEERAREEEENSGQKVPRRKAEVYRKYQEELGIKLPD